MLTIEINNLITKIPLRGNSFLLVFHHYLHKRPYYQSIISTWNTSGTRRNTPEHARNTTGVPCNPLLSIYAIPYYRSMPSITVTRSRIRARNIIDATCRLTAPSLDIADGQCIWPSVLHGSTVSFQWTTVSFRADLYCCMQLAVAPSWTHDCSFIFCAQNHRAGAWTNNGVFFEHRGWSLYIDHIDHITPIEVLCRFHGQLYRFVQIRIDASK